MLALGSLALVGCSSSTTAGPVEVAIEVRNGRTTPSGERISVTKGAQVTVTVRTDADVVVHVHGYDKEVHATPAKPASVSFTADLVGSFEIETHEPALVAAILVVR